MSALTNAILSQYPAVLGQAQAPAEYITIHGEVTRQSDPLWSSTNHRVVKLMKTANLPTTVARWLALGRKITGIAPYSC